MADTADLSAKEKPIALALHMAHKNTRDSKKRFKNITSFTFILSYDEKSKIINQYTDKTIIFYTLDFFNNVLIIKDFFAHFLF